MPQTESLTTDAYLSSESLELGFLSLVAQNGRQGRISLAGLTDLYLKLFLLRRLGRRA